MLEDEVDDEIEDKYKLVVGNEDDVKYKSEHEAQDQDK